MCLPQCPVHNPSPATITGCTSATNPTTVVCGESYAFMIGASGDRWRPQLCGTGSATLSTCGSSGSLSDTRIYIPCNNDDFEPCGQLSQCTAVIDGCHELDIGAYGDATGRATMRITGCTPPTNPTTVACGESYTFTIDASGDRWRPQLCGTGSATLSTCGSSGSLSDTMIYIPCNNDDSDACGQLSQCTAVIDAPPTGTPTLPVSCGGQTATVRATADRCGDNNNGATVTDVDTCRQLVSAMGLTFERAADQRRYAE
eukprot:gene56759-biopygen98882